MHASIEGESLNDDALFGSGFGRQYSSVEDQHCEDWGNQAGTSQTCNLNMENATSNTDGNIAEIPSDGVFMPFPSSWLRNHACVTQPRNFEEAGGATETRDPVVRNKSSKNKENKVKNINQKKQTISVNEIASRNTQVEARDQTPWQPELRYKRHDIEPVDRKTKNRVKEKKQSKNSNIVQSMSENQPCANGVNTECSYLVANGIQPNENPQNISKIYVKQPSNNVINPSQRNKRMDSGEYPLTCGISVEEDNETAIKAVDNSFPQIKNDLWGMRKKENNQVSLPSLQLQAPSLNLSFANGNEELETDEVPNRSPVILPTTPSDSVCHSPMQRSDMLHIPIVSQYCNESATYQNNNHRSPNLPVENGNLALALNGTEQVGTDVFQGESVLNSMALASNIPTSLYFGEGDNDRVLAHQLQHRFDREGFSSQGLDIGPDEFYSHDNVQNEAGDTPEDRTADHVVCIERRHTDLYEPDDNEHSCGHVYIPYAMQSSVEQPQSTSSSNVLPSPDGFHLSDDQGLIEQLYLREDNPQAGPVVHTENGLPSYSMQEAVSIHGGYPETAAMDDEAFARMLQEQLNLEAIGSQDVDQDEQYARHLQEMENDRRYWRRGRQEHRTHQPLHTRYGRNTWSRPLQIDRPVQAENVYDSRPRRQRTWDRPLHRRGGRHGGNEFSFLDNIHSLPDREGYDIPPGGDMYRYEYDPDYMLDEHEDHLISINRDPRMLASYLMERAPDMMVPNDIDLDDYEALWELAEGLGEVRRVGMEQTEISLLPVHTYQPAANTDGENSKTDCLVCLNAFSQGEQLRTLPCCHIYHLECIDEWLKRNAICPVCRQSAKQGEQ